MIGTMLGPKTNVRELISSGQDSRQSSKPDVDFKGKQIDDRHSITDEVVTSVLIWKYCEPWNKVPCILLYSQIFATCEYITC